MVGSLIATSAIVLTQMRFIPKSHWFCRTDFDQNPVPTCSRIPYRLGSEFPLSIETGRRHSRILSMWLRQAGVVFEKNIKERFMAVLTLISHNCNFYLCVAWAAVLNLCPSKRHRKIVTKAITKHKAVANSHIAGLRRPSLFELWADSERRFDLRGRCV
jgi:hypothetical protein